jgi:urea transport system ATP-binding protein
MLQVNELNQYYGGSHILRGVSFEAVREKSPAF